MINFVAIQGYFNNEVLEFKTKNGMPGISFTVVCYSSTKKGTYTVLPCKAFGKVRELIIENFDAFRNNQVVITGELWSQKSADGKFTSYFVQVLTVGVTSGKISMKFVKNKEDREFLGSAQGVNVDEQVPLNADEDYPFE